MEVPFDPDLKAALEKREMRMEHRINVARAGIYAGMMVLDILNAKLEGFLGPQYMQASVCFGVVFAGYALFVHVLTRGAEYRWWLKYVTVTVDLSVAAGFFALMHFPPFKDRMPMETTVSILVMFVLVINMVSGLRSGRAILVYGTAFGTLITGIALLEPSVSLELRIWSIPVVLLSGLLLDSSSQNFGAVFASLRRRDKLLKFISRDLVDLVESGRLRVELGGSEVVSTILFADIRGFTTLSEHAAPQALVGQLNDYFTVMSGIVRRNGGMVDKYIGDALMAVYGTPVPRKDDAQRAMLSAITMHRALDDLNTRWEREGKPIMRAGIALHTGEVIAGNIGSPDRMEYTVIGDTVNLASRLEELNKMYGTRLLFSGETRSALQSVPVGCRFVERARVRGRQGLVDLFSVE